MLSLFSSDPPASSSKTDTSVSSDSLLAITAPADPDPTIENIENQFTFRMHVVF